MKKNKWSVLMTMLVFGFGLCATRAEAALLKRQITGCGTIGQAGLYTLTQNIVATGDCIVVQVDFVTIDLSSFTITGNGTGSGITVNAAHKGIVLRDGTITNFANGIYLPACTNTLVEKMRVIQTTGFGAVMGAQAIVKDSLFAYSGAGFSGLTVGEESVVTGNIANNNGDFGIALGGGRSTAVSNVVANNAGSGFGVFTGGATLVNNTAAQNGFYGFQVVCPSNLIGNTAWLNPNGGFSTTVNCNDNNNVVF